MKYIQQFIDLNKSWSAEYPSETTDPWLEGLKDIPPPDDKEYNWTIVNTHVTLGTCLLIIWQGYDKVLKGPEKPDAPSPPPPRWNPNG